MSEGSQQGWGSDLAVITHEVLVALNNSSSGNSNTSTHGSPWLLLKRTSQKSVRSAPLVTDNGSSPRPLLSHHTQKQEPWAGWMALQP